MNDSGGELREVSRFSLRGLLVGAAACAAATAAVAYGSPFWWLMCVLALALLAGISAYRLRCSSENGLAASVVVTVIGGIGLVQIAIARHPWTGSWLMGLAWREAATGNGTFTEYGASALGILYSLCWMVAALAGGYAVRLFPIARKWVRGENGSEGEQRGQGTKGSERFK